MLVVGIPCAYTSPLEGIGKYVKANHQAGCTNVACGGAQQPIDEAVNAARQADATVLVVGLDQSIEAEMVDRTSLLLPGLQQELVTKVAAASRGPVVLVLICGGPIDVSFAENNPSIRAILWAGYPGEAGGMALADVLFGTYNPGTIFIAFKKKFKKNLKKILKFCVFFVGCKGASFQ